MLGKHVLIITLKKQYSFGRFLFLALRDEGQKFLKSKFLETSHGKKKNLENGLEKRITADKG